MSSDIISRVDALDEKAEKLIHKGHVLSAAENFGRAAEAASALGADNVIVAHMQLRQGVVLGAYALRQPDTSSADPRAVATYRGECIALCSTAIMALERRRVAGTLLEGKCTAVEQEWCVARLLRVHGESISSDKFASRAKLFGYEQFVLAALDALNVLSSACDFAAECSEAQFHMFAEHVVLAAELMQQPRCMGDMGLRVESAVVDRLRKTVAHSARNGLDARLVQLLKAALLRLERSGVIQERNMDEKIERITASQQKLASAIDKNLAAPDLRSCALASCGAKEGHPAHYKRCAACHAVVYCCKEHQTEHWPSHKAACKAARKAAAAMGEAGGA